MRLTPKGGRDGVDGLGDGPDGPVLKARVRAPPEKGAANAALEKLIAGTLGVPKSAVRLVAGQKARLKTLEVTGDPAVLSARLSELVKATD